MHRLGSSNQTTFILVAFTFEPRVQLAFFILFLIIYSISLLGNIAIIVAICLNQRLRTPMYSFLCSLAFLDIWFISSTVPKLLAILVSDERIISLPGCIMQFYFYLSLGGTEFYLLAVMSLDRYAAICHPLRYHSIISSRTCLWLILLSWFTGFFTFIYPTILMFDLSFCGPFEINHFFCDSSAVAEISCSDIRIFDLFFSSLASTVILGSFTMTLVSYSNILFTILNIPSADGRKKAFSTCTSHFTAVSLAYGSAIVIYVRPVESSSPNLNKGVALLNSVLTPLLNPFIYSLRNKQVQNVLKDTLCRKSEFS
ncbi:LOW QUALITY PROTEIN: olfactory receptor 49-like [Bombina bombina]|uniref:LOW QUALITY PROTEIN: olfactory receptor 49-like n=1 Tax=Bombina bombina TaxID=8345 RepID=UPI00235B1D9C|nr:LOW QUALITY PROTEIN: olfactory receptor 49-like [Bombina bombina]